MPLYLQKLLAHGGYLMDEAGDGTGSSGDGGGGGTGDAGGTGSGDGGSEGDQGGDSGKSGTKPSDSEAKLLKEVMEKKNKLQKATEELNTARETLKKFEGLDPVQIRALLADVEARKTQELEAKGQWEALKKQMAEQHTTALTAKEQALKDSNAANEALRAQIAELTVGNSFGASKYIAENSAFSPSKVRTVFGSHFEFDGEKVVAYDKPAGSKGRSVMVDASGDPLSFEAAIQKLIEADPDRDQLLKSKVRTGAGSSTEPKGKPPRQTVEVFGRDKIAAALASRKK